MSTTIIRDNNRLTYFNVHFPAVESGRDVHVKITEQKTVKKIGVNTFSKNHRYDNK